VADMLEHEATEAAAEIDGLAVACDVTRESDIQQLVNETKRVYGSIDLFCSNAGISVSGGPEVANDQWQRIWDINLMAHVFAARHLVPRMIARGGGYLLNTASAAGLLASLNSMQMGAPLSGPLMPLVLTHTENS